MTDAENEEHRQETASEQEPEASGNQEAAEYRRRLREAETERDKLAEQVQTLRQAEVERQVSDRLADPTDIWRAEVELDQLLDEQGGIDPERLEETVSTVVRDHPNWRKREQTGFDEYQGKTSGQPVGASWSGLLRSGTRER